MTEGVPTLSREGEATEILTSSAFLVLLETGRSQHRLTLDEVMPALGDVELTPEVIEAVTERIVREGIQFDGAEWDLRRAAALTTDEARPADDARPAHEAGAADELAP